MSSVCRKLRLPLLLALVLACAAATEPQRVLRVAADPNNLPFSNERREGFENRIAELLAREMGARLEYMWWPQRRGFFRETINAGRADLVVGVPADFELVLTTRPYYRSTYVFVFRRGDPPVRTFDDRVLRRVRVGVQLIGDDFINSPPAHALAIRGIVNNVRGYTVFGNYAQESPPSDIIRAVADGDIGVAVAWGPMAGYFARRQKVPLEITPVQPEQESPVLRYVFPIAMGVRRGNEALKREIEGIIDQQQAAIAAILDDYGVPQVPLTKQEVRHVTAR